MRRGSRRPQLRLPRHRATTAHICSAYPWGVQNGLGFHGAYIGTDVYAGGGAWIYDIFDAYTALAARGGPTNTNMLVLGEPGQGKSALIKSYLYRMAAIYGSTRWIAIVDVKGEYRRLADAMELVVVQIAPGGTTRINPLDAQPGADIDAVTRRQAAMVEALTSAVLERRITPIEDVAIWTALETLNSRDSTGRARPTLADLAAVLANPTDDMATAAKTNNPADLATETREIGYALDKLLTRSLQGMFNGPSTVTLDTNNPGVVIDLSAVPADSAAMPLVMVAATAWLQELITHDTDGVNRIQVLDECWRMVAHEGTARYLQTAWKLGRSLGIANIAILHRPSDLPAQADDGTATAKIAEGLLADTGTKVLLQQADEELARSAELLGLNQTQRRHVATLHRGRSLWKVGAHCAVVHHHLSPFEAAFCDTDTNLNQTPSTQAEAP